MAVPSTDWKEVTTDDEAKRFEHQRDQIMAAQAIKNARFGKDRFLHRKPVLAAAARVDVFPDLPDHARAGLFGAPASYDAIVRLSNGSFDIQANTKPDIRGFAIKILGVTGPAALGGEASEQDFLTINHDHFAARNSSEFVDLAYNLATKGDVFGGFSLFTQYGLFGGIQRAVTLAQTLMKPFKGFAAETFNTCVPFAVGAYAARLHVTPVDPRPRATADAGADIEGRLAVGPIVYSLGLQFFTDEAATPIENPMVVWNSPVVPVATLTLLSLQANVEPLKFDPWNSLEAHRPLGEIMRARKSAYFASQQGRA